MYDADTELLDTLEGGGSGDVFVAVWEGGGDGEGLIVAGNSDGCLRVWDAGERRRE